MIFKSWNKLIITKSILLLWCFFTIYPINFTFLPMSTSKILSVLSIGYLIILITLGKIKIYKNSIFILPFIIFYMYFMWVFFRTGFTGFEDTYFLNNAVIHLIEVLPNVLFIGYLSKRSGINFTIVLQIIQNAIFIQAIFILLSFLSYEFREFTIGIIPPGGNVDPLSEYRVRGLTHGAGAGLSIVQSMGVFISAFLLLTRKKSLYLFISISLISISILLTGMTGFLIVFPILIMVLKMGKFNTKNGIKKMLVILAVPFILYSALLVFESSYKLIGPSTMPWGEDAFDRVKREFTSEFISSGEDRLIPVTIYVLLERHIMFPEDIETFVFGNPKNYSVDRVHSDMGPIRRIFSLGIVGLILTYSYIIMFFTLIIKNIKDMNVKLFLKILMVWLFFVELKEPFITDIRFSYIYFIILAVAYINRDTFISKQQL